MVNHRFILKFILHFLFSNRKLCTTDIGLLEQNTKCRRVRVHIRGLFLPFDAIGIAIPVVRLAALADLQLSVEQCGMARPRNEEQLLKLTPGDTFTLTSWQFKFQLH